MPTNHDAVGALPSSGAVRASLRSLLFARMPYALADSDNPQDLVAVDPETGSVIWDILYLGRIFHYDPLDTTTAHDGVTTLVTQGGRRYKLDTLALPKSVLDKDLTAPPGSPSVGDAYLINGAPSGGWSAFSVGDIVVLTARGWEAIEAADGSIIYVEDETGFYHRAAGGSWAAGFGATPLSTNGVPMSAAINFGRRVIVENQTTNAPPSAAQAIAYIIGSSPTGDWSGHAGKVAIRETAGTSTAYSIYTPAVGWTAFDKATGIELRFNGTAWVSLSGTWVAVSRVQTATGSGNLTATGSSHYEFSIGTAPTTSRFRTLDPVTLAHTANRTGAKLRLRYDCDVTEWSAAGISNASRVGAHQPAVVAIFRDSETDAIAWAKLPLQRYNDTLTAFFDPDHIGVSFEFDALDASAHTYTVGFLPAIRDNGSTDEARTVRSCGRRLLTIEEGA